MKKLLLLMTALLMGVSGAWAYDVTVAESTTDPDTYATRSNSNLTLTTTATSGVSGLTLVSSNSSCTWDKLTQTTPKYRIINFSGLSSETTTRITMTAPTGYVIICYEIKALRNSSRQNYTLTAADETSESLNDANSHTFAVKDVFANETYFDVTGTAASNTSNNYLDITDITVVIGRLDNTMSTTKKYVIDNQRGGYLTTYNNLLCSTYSGSRGNAKEFAIVEHNGNKYLYSVSDSKYIAASDRRLTTVPSSLFTTVSTGNDTYPIRPKLNGLDICTTLWESSSAPTGYTDGIKIVSADNDEGIRYRMYDTGDFDASSLTSALDAFSANEVTLIMNTSHGDFYRDGTTLNNTNGTWCNKWISSVPEAPIITVSLSANGMTSNGELANTQAATYTISVPVGYVIKSYTIISTNDNANANTITSTADDVTTEFPANTVTTKNVPSSGTLGIRSTKFTVATNKALNTKLQITVKRQTAVSSLSDLSNTKCYTVESASRGNWAVAPSGTQLTHNKQTGLDIAYSANDTKQQFAFIYYDATPDNGEDDGVYYLYSVSERKFIAAAGTDDNDALDLSTEATQSVSLLETGVSGYPVCVEMSNGGDLNIRSGASYIPGVVIYGTGGSHKTDGGNAVCIYEAGDFDPTYALALLTGARTCTYDVRFGGVSVATANESQVVGAAPSLPISAQKAYCTYSYYSDAACTKEMTEIPASDTIYAKCTWDGPFEFSSDFASATWYYMTLRNKYAQNDGNNPYLLSTTKVMAPKGHWAFMGNPYAVKVINELAGDGKYLDDGTHPQMGTTGTEWILTESSTSGTFQLHIDANKYINDNGGFSYWNTAYAINAEGSLLRVEEVPTDFMDQVTANIMPYVDAPGDGYFRLTKNEATMFQDAINTYYEDSKISDEEYNTLITALPGYINYPRTGYYIITNDNKSNMYMGFPNNGEDYSALMIYDDLGINTIAKLEKQTGNTYHVSFQGKYLYSWGSGSTIAGFSGYKTNVSGSVEDESVVLKSNNAYIYADGTNDNKVIGWKTNNYAKWTIVDAAGTELEIALNTVGSKSYATFSAPFPVTIGDNAKAYTVKLNGDRAVYSEIESKQIPAGAGILLISETAAANVTATISAKDFDALKNNDLVGFYLAQTFSYDTSTSGTWYLGLGNHATSGIGFYQISSATGANKAYLPYAYTTGESVRGFVLVAGDDPTGINTTINADTAAKNYFDLSGRRVSKPTQGVYILNGKKVLVK